MLNPEWDNPAMAGPEWRVRAGVLVLAGALVIHELRYALAGVIADEHAHSYMSWLGPLICGFVILTGAEFVFRVMRRYRPSEMTAVPRGPARWLGFAGLLLAIFAAQEIVEAFVAHGRVELAEALVQHGGWLSGPLALAVGGVIALLLRGARALLARRGAPPRRTRLRPPVARRPLLRDARPRLGVLACNLAGRGPPAPFVV